MGAPCCSPARGKRSSKYVARNEGAPDEFRGPRSQSGQERRTRTPSLGRRAAGDLGESASKLTLDFKSIGAPASAKLRDLLDHKDLGAVQNSYSAEVPTHGVVLVRVSK